MRSTGYRAGLNEDKIAEGALRLTGCKGINGWSMRDLAAELDVSPSVVYHYFSNREAICTAVLERVGSMVEVPDSKLPWKDWFLAVSLSMRKALLAHNGVADLLLVNRFPLSLVPIAEGGVGKLREAGFGDLTPYAYAMIMNTALGAIAARDHRSANERNQKVDLAQTVRELGEHAAGSQALSEFLSTFMAPLAEQDRGEGAGEMSDRYFTLIIRSMLNGIESTLK